MNSATIQRAAAAKLAKRLLELAYAGIYSPVQEIADEFDKNAAGAAAAMNGVEQVLASLRAIEKAGS